MVLKQAILFLWFSQQIDLLLICRQTWHWPTPTPYSPSETTRNHSFSYYVRHKCE